MSDPGTMNAIATTSHGALPRPPGTHIDKDIPKTISANPVKRVQR